MKLLAAATLLLAPTTMAATSNTLWYTTPAAPGMNEALPIGNGRIGALVYGGERERLVLNDSSLWTGDENPSGNYDTMGQYQCLGNLWLTPAGASVPQSGVTIGAAKLYVPSGHIAYNPNEEVQFASDGNPSTKWCVETGSKPVVWQTELPAGSPPATWYAFTSANDVPDRDPNTWDLAGSNDGEKWTVLDHREKQPPLPARGQTKRYTFANTTAYRYYRFTFAPTLGVSHFQLAELSLEGLKPGPATVAPKANVAPEQFRRELNIGDAIAATEYVQNSVHYRREAFASQPADVTVVRWSADKRGALSGTIELAGTHGEVTTTEGADLAFNGAFPNGLRYSTRVRVLPKGGTASIADNQLQLKNCDEATILIAARTNYIFDYAKTYAGPDPAPRVQTELTAAAKQSYATLKSEHIAAFQKPFNRVSLDLGTSPAEALALPTDQRRVSHFERDNDPAINALLFQYGRYLLISCSRPGALPANLQGLWNDSNTPPWHSDYHANINIQMNYWPAEVANLSEYHTPFFVLIQSQLEPWRKATAASPEFAVPGKPSRGFAIRTSHNIHGGMGWKWDKTANAWYCQHLWEHYAFTGDEAYLRQTAYPILKETCEFWEDHLKALPDGRLVVPHGWSPEHGPDEDGVSYNQQIVWDLFDNYVRAAAILKVDPDYAATVAAMRDKLVGPKIGNWGQLQEWMTDRDDPNDHHRHTSHLFAVFPGHQISLNRTPDLAKAAKISLDARGIAADSDVREWSFAWRCALYARLGDPKNAHEMLRHFFAARNSCPNLFGLHPPMQMDGNFGMTAAIAEMLLQSQDGEINLLPALPAEWPAGSFKGLRARGGFTVDASWKDARLTSATIHADRAAKVKIRYGTKVAEVTLKPDTPAIWRP